VPFARETSCDRLMPSLADGKHTNELCHRILAASYGAKGIDLQCMFRSYDKDGNGALTPNALYQACLSRSSLALFSNATYRQGRA